MDAPRYLDPRILRIGCILILGKAVNSALICITAAAPSRSLLEIGDTTDSIDVVDGADLGSSYHTCGLGVGPITSTYLTYNKQTWLAQ